MPQLGDPNFHRAVVLMLEHGDHGAMGLVINRTGPISLKDVAEGQAMTISKRRAVEPVYVGGPVEPQRGFVLHDRADVAEKAEVMPGLFLSVTLDALSGAAHRRRREGALLPRLLRLGRAAARVGDQGGRVAAHRRARLRRCSREIPATLWDETVRSMGFDPAMLVHAKGTN